MNLNRRSFMKYTASTAAGLWISSCLPDKAISKINQTVKEFHFTAVQTRVNLGSGKDFVAWTYNGQVPGPEIRVREGDIIRVVLKNNLPEDTTIHWHGIPLPNPMDGVPNVTQKPVAPGETFVYEFEARPAGSFIYHSHFKLQLDQGLYGPLIIEPLSETEAYDQEYTLLLEDWVLQDGGGAAAIRRRPAGPMMGGRMGMRRQFPTNQMPLPEPVYDGYAVNGRLLSAIYPIVVNKGDRVKLRLINPSSATEYYLSLAGHVLTVTHVDGNPIKPVPTEVLRIGMGERYDVRFNANNPGKWLLAAMETGLGEGMLRIPVNYRGIKRTQSVGPIFRQDMLLANYMDFTFANLWGDITLPPDRSIYQTLSGGMHSSFWTINGQVYPETDALRVQKGERVRLIYGNHSMMPHPMHLHGHFFKIVNPAIPPDMWILKDTLIVDPMQQIAVEFTADNPGKWLHHCHNLYHMEAGMANVVHYAQS